MGFRGLRSPLWSANWLEMGHTPAAVPPLGGRDFSLLKEQDACSVAGPGAPFSRPPHHSQQPWAPAWTA